MEQANYVFIHGNPIPDGTSFVEVAKVHLSQEGKPIRWEVTVGAKNVYSDFAGFSRDSDVRQHKTMFVCLDPDNIELPTGFVFDENYMAPGSHDDPCFCIHDGEIFIYCE